MPELTDRGDDPGNIGPVRWQTARTACEIMEDLVSGAERYRKILSALLPAGVLGMSILLGSTSVEAAREDPAGPRSNLGPQPQVAQRLAAIRDAVSDVSIAADRAAPSDGAEQLAWGNWGNAGIGIGIGGFGIGIGVPTWNDWHNGWNNWRNNWSNGWNNWSNGWSNY